jgi:hypothetical protein
MDIAALIVAIVSAAGSVYAVWYARAQARSAATATTLELRRRHDELTPQFEVTLQKPGSGAERLRLRLYLGGPPALGRLDALTLTILDNRAWRACGRGLSDQHGHPEAVGAQIWGPYRFANPDSGVPDDHRTRQARKMALGDELTFSLEPTVPPQWLPLEADRWMRETRTIQLQLECSREGRHPWTLPCQVDAALVPCIVEVP